MTRGMIHIKDTFVEAVKKNDTVLICVPDNEMTHMILASACNRSLIITEDIIKIPYLNVTLILVSERIGKRVSLHPSVLRCIDNQTEELCVAAVMRYGLALQYVKNQNERICIEAVGED